MIALEHARSRVLGACSPSHPKRVAINDALDCVSAEAVRSGVDVPSFTNSAMDGYAVRAADTASAPVRLRVVATTMAGMAPTSIAEGETARIMTGAPLPVGADGVCMVEETSDDPVAGTVVIGQRIAAGTFVREPGSDIGAGHEVLTAGTFLRPAHLGLLASIGKTDLLVHPKPIVGVLSTGDELAQGTGTLSPGKIRDANRPSLIGLVRQAECEPVDLGIVPDARDAIRDTLVSAAGHCHAVVASGGVSVGDADVVKTVLAELCGDSMSWMQIAIKPAKPFAFGTLGENRVPVFGVPGNPVSAMVSFELLVRPALRLIGGHRELERATTTGVADADLSKTPDGKTHFMRVRASVGDDGVLHVLPCGVQQSHVLSALAEANALAVVPDGARVPSGGRVSVLLLDAESLTWRLRGASPEW